MNKKEKKITALLVGTLAVLCIIGVTIYIVKFGGASASAAPASQSGKGTPVDYEAIYKAQCDSLYKNFATPSLKFAQVKGFVKSIEMETDDQSGYTRNLFKLSFDKEGTLVSMSHKSVRDKDYQWATCSITFNGDGYPSGFSYSTLVNGCYPDQGNFKFTYQDGVIKSVYADCALWEGGDETNYTFADLNEAGLPNAISFNVEGGVEGTEYKGSGSWRNNYSYDEQGNWIQASQSGSSTITSWDMGEETDKSTETNTISAKVRRTITYYQPDEIDYSRHLPKPGK